MGVSTPIAPYPSSAIGASAVRPIDLVAAFTTFANLGNPVEPRFILRATDQRGDLVYAPELRALPPAMDSAVAYVALQMMRGAVDHGTGGGRAPVRPGQHPRGGKDRDDGRQHRRVVRGNDAQPGGRGMAWVRPAAFDRPWGGRGRAGGADLWSDGGAVGRGVERAVGWSRRALSWPRWTAKRGLLAELETPPGTTRAGVLRGGHRTPGPPH